ncbi:hypothetical protein NLI96_g8847 [Meripilus lineatus]|uniref:Uncharacterized protein n=1 Tax=Meripilus lineatus TaxID=2056292 RepID=A0AAD5UY85_9APHY|nr:hypothetical protein NLI96_g8847 [Physisporinus lineatus]
MPPSLLRSYISAFPRLRSLVIDDFMEEELDLLPTQTEPHSPSIETLRISRSEEPGRMSSWFASTNTKNTLRCLHLDSRGLSRDALKGFLLEVSQTLVELDLKLRFTRCWSWPMPVVDEEPLDLSNATGLQSLTLRPSDARDIIETLSTVKSPSLPNFDSQSPRSDQATNIHMV